MLVCVFTNLVAWHTFTVEPKIKNAVLSVECKLVCYSLQWRYVHRECQESYFQGCTVCTYISELMIAIDIFENR